MNYSEIKSSAAKIATLETAIAEGYRALQSKLKDFQEKKIVHLQVKLNSSFAVLKAEAERIIESYRPYTKPQDAIETVEQKTDEVVASLPSGIIVNNSGFGDHINTGNPDEKIWLANKDKNGEGVTLVKTECGQYYQSYAGDALRLIVLLGMPTYIWEGVLKTLVAVRDVVRLQENAKKLGLTLHLYDRTSDSEHAQILTAIDIHNANSLIDRLKEYESERQRQAVRADLAWKEQLPDAFLECPKTKALREKFRRMFNQLNKQEIFVKYSADFSDSQQHSWKLENKETGISGGLTWYKEPDQWTIDGFYFQDEEGNPIDEFNDVESL